MFQRNRLCDVAYSFFFLEKAIITLCAPPITIRRIKSLLHKFVISFTSSFGFVVIVVANFFFIIFFLMQLVATQFKANQKLNVAFSVGPFSSFYHTIYHICIRCMSHICCLFVCQLIKACILHRNSFLLFCTSTGCTKCCNGYYIQHVCLYLKLV